MGLKTFLYFSWVLMMIMSDFYFGFVGVFAKPSEPEFFVARKLAQIWEI